MVLFASSSHNLQPSLERFTSEWKAVEMRVPASKSETRILSLKTVVCPLQVKDEILSHLEKFQYLRVLFTSEGRNERGINRWISAASACGAVSVSVCHSEYLSLH